MTTVLKPNLPPAVIEKSAIAELCNVTKTYTVAGGREMKVLDQIDLAIHEGELLALLGQSGSGKSTLLRCLTGLTVPTTGRVLAYGKVLQGINPHASIVFQTFALYPWLTVEQNVAVGLMSKLVTRAEKEAAMAKEIYEELNDQLTAELPQLIDLRVPYLDPSFEALVKIQLRFCKEGYERMAQVQQYLDPQVREDYAQVFLEGKLN